MTNQADEILHLFRTNSELVSGSELRQALRENLPAYMLEEYRASRDWKIRLLAVRYAVGYSRRNEIAVQLGKLALSDRSKIVRFEACALLACSLRGDAVKFLEEARQKFQDSMTRDGALVAIDAIENQNHTYFWDKDHSGMFEVNFEAPVLP